MTAARPARRVSWDLLRCAFLLMVVLYHGTFIAPLVYHQFAPRILVFAHQIGASLLLALSAYFVAAGLSDPARATARWWWSRVTRLLPAFVVATLLAFAALRWLAPAGMFHPSLYNLVTNLVMLWNWNGVRHWFYVDPSYWTLPLQLMAFSLAPLLRRSRLGRGRGLRVLLWAAVLVPLAQWPLEQTAGPIYDTVADGLGLYRWHLFVAGVTVWMLATGRVRRGHGAALLATCVAAHAVQIGTLLQHGGLATDPWSVLGVGLGLLAMTAAAIGPDVAAWLPGPVVRAVTSLAGCSYGIFLVHQTLGDVLMLRLQEDFGAGPGLQLAAMLLNGVAVGALLTRFVERPAHRALLRTWDRRHEPDRLPAVSRGVRPVGVPLGVSALTTRGWGPWRTACSSPTTTGPSGSPWPGPSSSRDTRSRRSTTASARWPGRGRPTSTPWSSTS
ncbi:acyltransferase family protein [Actinomycetospora sp. CA-053990]|uniref:acyltransferase family protein n=1 Tax=Actinomycetospora sp. CA-053990 TaxID=3239891 RepID=UPI003D926B1D